MLVDELIGTKMKVLTGYQGQNEINLAAERGEVQGNNTGLSNLTVNKADWLRDGKVRILLQFGNERLPQLPDVPTAIELASSDADKAMLRFYGLKFTMARPLLIPPQVPAERTAALQAAFEATMQDPAYIDEARRIGLDTNWLGAKALAERVARHRRDAAGGGRSPARAARPRRRQIVGAVMAATRRGWHSPAKTCCMMSNDFRLGG